MPERDTSLDSLYPVTEEESRQYQRDGQILLRGLASRAEIAAYRPEIQRTLRDVSERKEAQGRIEDYSSLFVQVTNVWRLNDLLRRFVLAKRFAGAAARLMGVPRVRLYHDQALFKPAGGKPTPWHQDQFYWPLETAQTISLWMPLIDLTKEMGTMIFANGSHREGPLVPVSISEESDRRFRVILEERRYLLASYDVGAGDATFHSGWTAHAAHANTSGATREVLTVIYYADGARIKEPENEFQRTDMRVFHPGLMPGDVAASPLNPLVFSEEAKGESRR
jgi:ectoine hydroxylase-related dioxygenase (phytanoyl-CoA dioxygenase family)